MKMKVLTFLTALLGLTTLAQAGDIYEVRPLENTAPYADREAYGSMDDQTTWMNGGEEVWFTIRMCNVITNVTGETEQQKMLRRRQALQTHSTLPWSLQHIGLSSEILDDAQSPLQVGIVVGGRTQWATVAKATVNANNANYTDMLCYYRVQPGDLALPIRFAADGVGTPINDDSTGLCFRNGELWQLQNVDEDGVTKIAADFTFKASFEPEGIASWPEPTTGLTAMSGNHDLSECGFFVRTVDFTDRANEEKSWYTADTAWRGIYSGVTGAMPTTPSVSVTATTQTTIQPSTLYVWSEDPGIVDVVGGKSVKMIDKDNPTGDRKEVNVATISVVDGKAKYTFSLKGTGDTGKTTTLVLSQYPGYTVNTDGGTVNTDYLTIPVIVIDPPEPFVTASLSDRTVNVPIGQANFTKPISELTLTLSEVNEVDTYLQVTYKKPDGAANDWNHYIGSSLTDVGSSYKDHVTGAGYADPDSKDVIKIKAGEASTKLYLFGLAADDNTTGEGISITVEQVGDDTKYKGGTNVGDTLRINPVDPVITSPASPYDYVGKVASGKKLTITYTIQDTYRNLLDAYTFTWDGEAQTIAAADHTSGKFEITTPQVWNKSGVEETQNIAYSFSNAAALDASGVVNVTVKPTQHMTLVPTDGVYTFGESSSESREFAVTFSPDGYNITGERTALLYIKPDDTVRDCIDCDSFVPADGSLPTTGGIEVQSDETTTSQHFKMTFKDGCSITKSMQFKVVMYKSDRSAVLEDYQSYATTLTAENVAPQPTTVVATVNGIEHSLGNGGQISVRKGETVSFSITDPGEPSEVDLTNADDSAVTAAQEAYDTAYDKWNKATDADYKEFLKGKLDAAETALNEAKANVTYTFKTQWFITDTDKQPITSTTVWTGDPTTHTGTYDYTFKGTNTLLVAVQSRDKDMNTWGEITYITVRADGYPTLELYSKECDGSPVSGYTVSESTKAGEVNLYARLVGGTALDSDITVDLKVSPTPDATNGSIETYPTSITIPAGSRDGEKAVALRNFDGTEVSLDDGFTITGKVTGDTHVSDATVLFRVENVAPEFKVPTLAAESITNRVDRDVDVMLKWTVSDCDLDMTEEHPLTVTCSACSDVTQTATKASSSGTFTFTLSGSQNVTLTVTDKDGGTATRTLIYAVNASKPVETRAIGATASGITGNPSAAYCEADGRGTGKVTVSGAKLSTAEGTQSSIAKWNMGIGASDCSITAEATPCVVTVDGTDVTYQSYFYTWVRYQSGTSGYTQSADDPLPEDGNTAVFTLGTSSDGNNSFATIGAEAIFSREYLRGDLCGDINQDGVPDKDVIKYGLVTTFDGSTDLKNIRNLNNDGDTLPVNVSQGWTLVSTVDNNIWKSPAPFGARLEIRGFGDGLNPKNIQSADQLNLTDKEKEALVKYLGLGTTAAAWDDYPAETKVALWNGTTWTCENPSDPTVADTDADGINDGLEYYYWYSAVVYGKTGRKLNLYHPLTPDTITPEDIAKRYNPTVYNADFANVSSAPYNLDMDNDGLSDLEELTTGTDPLDYDSDRDGLPDGWEIMWGLNPCADDISASTKANWNPDGDFMAECDGNATYTIYKVGDNYYAYYDASDEDNLPEPIERWDRTFVTEPSCLRVFRYGGVGSRGISYLPYGFHIPTVAGVPSKLAAPLISDKAVDPVGTLFDEDGNFLEGVETVAVTTLTYIHDQVYCLKGFSPVTGWMKLSNGYVASRWQAEAANNMNMTGLAEDTTAYTTADEYLLQIYYANACGVANLPAACRPDSPSKPDMWYCYSAYTTNPSTAGVKTAATETTSTASTSDDGTTSTSNSTTTVTTTINYPGADSNADGVPDGWTLYVGHNPNASGDLLNSYNTADWNDNDKLSFPEEYRGTDSIQAYSSCSSIYSAYSSWKWINKFFPSDPNEEDTDGDDLIDGEECDDAYLYNSMTDDGSSILFAGAGLNPLSVDTDGDQLPDSWEAEYVGETEPEAIEDNLADCFWRAIGKEKGSSTNSTDGTTFLVYGMDGTVSDANRDIDGDGLVNWQEYYLQAIRHFRYDDTVTPLMGKFQYVHATDTGCTNITVLADFGADTTTLPKWFWDGMSVYSQITALNAIKGYIVSAYNLDGSYTYQDVHVQECAANPDDYEFVMYKKETACIDIGYAVDGDPIFSPWCCGVTTNNIMKAVDKLVKAGDVTEEQRLEIYAAVTNINYRNLGYFVPAPYTWDARQYNNKTLNPPTYVSPTMGVFGEYEPKATFRYMFAPRNWIDSTQAITPKYICGDPRVKDTDNDEMNDYWELFHGLNPLYGAADGLGDVVRKAWGGTGSILYPSKANGQNLSANYNGWSNLFGDTITTNENEALHYNVVRYPWLTGYPQFDADGDGLRNEEEKLLANVTKPTNYHTDPSPAWYTDDSNEKSFVSQYYHIDGGDVGYFPWSLSGTADDKQYTPGSAYQGYSTVYAFAFERNEGYDTDNDWISDAQEMTSPITGASEPQDSMDIDRRQAVHFNGEDSALVSRMANMRANRGTAYFYAGAGDLFRQFTVEAWVCPEDVSRDQVILERAVDVPMSTLSNAVAKVRANFRIGIHANGHAYGAIDDRDAVDSETGYSTKIIESTNKLVADTWVHITLAYDGEAVTLYLNGVSDNVSENMHLVPVNGVTLIGQYPNNAEIFPIASYEIDPSAMIIGAQAVGSSMNAVNGETDLAGSLKNFFKGSVDEVRVWDGARKASDILADYQKRYTRSDLAQNREEVFEAWTNMASRSEGAALTLPPELVYHYNFNNLPGATETNLVAQLPGGFDKLVQDNMMDQTGTNRFDIAIGWWSQHLLRSTVYADPRVVPYVENNVDHMPVLDGSSVDDFYWGKYDAGWVIPSDGGVSEFTFKNEANPYRDYNYLGDRVNHAQRLKALFGTTSTAYLQYAFDTRCRLIGTSDLIPLGGTFVKTGDTYWDGQGPTAAWSLTGTDTTGEGLPDWARTYFGLGAEESIYKDVPFTDPSSGRTMMIPAYQAYIRLLALGLTPMSDGMGSITNAEIRAESNTQALDLDGNGIPDWWENTYGVAGQSVTTDSDRDGLTNYQEYEIEMKEGIALDPTKPTTGGNETEPVQNVRLLAAAANTAGGNEIDYFRTVTRDGKTYYLGELYGDHDFMQDADEDVYDAMSYITSTKYDPDKDEDQDGWSNWAELRAGTSPKVPYSAGCDGDQVAEYPVPVVTIGIGKELSANTNASFVVKAWSEQSLEGEPDAMWKIGGTSTEQATTSDTVGTKRSKYIGMNPNRTYNFTMGPGQVTPGSVQIDFKDPSWVLYSYWYIAGSAYYYRTIMPLGEATWQGSVTDLARNNSTEFGDIIWKKSSSVNVVVGSINYTTGACSIDFSKLQDSVRFSGNISNNATGTTGTSEESEVSYFSEVDMSRSYVKAFWQTLILDPGKKGTYYLSDASTGHLREGPNTFVVFQDDNANGTWDSGEAMGFVRDVEVGWDAVPALSVTLTKESGYSPRFKVPENMSSWRIVRTAINDVALETPRVIRSGAMGDTEERSVNEAMLLASGSLGMDKTLVSDAQKRGIALSGLETATYSLQAVSNSVAVTLGSYYRRISKREVPAPYSPTLVMEPTVVTPQPTFTFKGEVSEYSKVILQVAKEGEDTATWSFTNDIPAQVATGGYEIAVPLYAGEHAELASQGTYRWRAALISDVFDTAGEEDFSAWTNFTTDVTAKLGYGCLDTTVKYYGPAENGQDLVVGVYTAGDFTGLPVARQTITLDRTGEMAVHFVNLPLGSYYVMAYVDRKDGTAKARDSYETWGYYNNVANFIADIYEPLAVTITMATKADNTHATCTVYLEDTDVNRDGTPDCLQKLDVLVEKAEEVDPEMDTDGDGLTDVDETEIYGTDPKIADTDRDGIPDGWEVKNNLDPLDKTDAQTYNMRDVMAYVSTNLFVAVYVQDNGQYVEYVVRPGDEKLYTTFYTTDGKLVVGRPTNLTRRESDALQARDVILIHSAVYDFFGYDPSTARYTEVDATNVVYGASTSPFTVLWKYYTNRKYLTAFGIDNDPVQIDMVDGTANGILDGWELYVGLADANKSKSFPVDTTESEIFKHSYTWDYDPFNELSIYESTTSTNLTAAVKDKLVTFTNTEAIEGNYLGRDWSYASDNDVMAYVETNLYFVVHEGVTYAERPADKRLYTTFQLKDGTFVVGAPTEVPYTEDGYEFQTNAVIIHAGVNDFFGFNSGTARSDSTNALNTVKFTDAWKEVTNNGYLPQFGITNKPLKFGAIDCTNNGIDDGWELYVKLADVSSKSFPTAGTDAEMLSSLSDLGLDWTHAADGDVMAWEQIDSDDAHCYYKVTVLSGNRTKVYVTSAEIAVGDTAVDTAKIELYEGYDYGTVLGVGGACDAITGKVIACEPATVAFTHHQVYTRNGYNTLTANSKLDLSDTVNTKAFTAYDKYVYFTQTGRILNLKNCDSDLDGLPDGWEIYVGLDPLDPNDARQADTDGDGLTPLQEYNLGVYPSDPSNKYSLYDEETALTDDIAHQYNMETKDRQLIDSDYDGLSNWAEYLANRDYADQLKASGGLLDVNNKRSDGDRLDYFRQVTVNGRTWYLGEVCDTDPASLHNISDHDFVEDMWEDKYSRGYANRYLYDARKDYDDDGWSNWSEARAYYWNGGFYSDIIDTYIAGNIEEQLNCFAQPVIGVRISYNGSQDVSGKSLVVRTRRGTKADATFQIAGAQEAQSSSENGLEGRQILGTYSGSSAMRGYLNPGNLVASSVHFQMTQIAGDITYFWTCTKCTTPSHSGSYQAYEEDIHQHGLATENADKKGVTLNETKVDWQDIVSVKSGSDAVTGELVATNGYTVGTINFRTGAFDINLDALTKQCGLGLENMVFKANFSYILGEYWPQTVWLSNPDTGYIREGKNVVEAFYDLDEDGEYDIDEPYGYINDVDIGWHKTELRIELSDDSTSGISRFAIPAQGGRKLVRIYRTAINGKVITPVAVYSKNLDLTSAHNFTGSDLIDSGAIDFDPNLVKAAAKQGINQTSIYSADYSVYVGDMTNMLHSFTRIFDTKQIAPVLTDEYTNLNYKVLTEQPALTWKATSGYPTFVLELAEDAAFKKTVYTVTNMMPAAATIGCTFKPDLYVGEDLKNNTVYFWHVKQLNAKYLDNAWSETGSFQTADDSSSADTGYGKLAVNVRYYGPATVDKLVVAAYTTADFTGAPLGRTTTNALGRVTLDGLEPGKYYVMAFLDTNGNRVHDPYESWGYVNRVDTEAADLYTPVALDVVSTRYTIPTGTIYIEDTDVNQNFMPDGLEDMSDWTDDKDSPEDANKPDEDTDWTYAAEGDIMAYKELTGYHLLTGDNGKLYIAENGITVGGEIQGEVYEALEYSTGVYALGNKVTLSGVKVNSSDEQATVIATGRAVYEIVGFNSSTATEEIPLEDTVDTKAMTTYDKFLYYLMTGRKLDYTTNDTDGDGLPDGWEIYVGLDPTDPSDVSKISVGTANMADDEEKLTNLQEYKAETDPNSAHTLGDILDCYTAKYNLVHSSNDDDGDGLSNYAEYLISEVFKFAKLDPNNPKTDGDVVDYYRKQGDFYFGEIFTDHDQDDDAWEDQYQTQSPIYGQNYTTRYKYDADRDYDDDGWSNWSEAQMRTNPSLSESPATEGSTVEHPVPTIAATVIWNGQGNNTISAPVVIEAWSEDTWNSILEGTERPYTVVPDAIWTTGNSSTNGIKRLGRNPGVKRMYSLGNDVVPGSVTLQFKDEHFTYGVYSNGTYKVTQQGLVEKANWIDGAKDNSLGMLIECSGSAGTSNFVGTVDYTTGKLVINFPAFREDSRQVLVDLNGNDIWQRNMLANSLVQVSWTSSSSGLNRSKTYYLTMADSPIENTKAAGFFNQRGFVREGKNKFVVFADCDENGAYTAGEPFAFIDDVDVGYDHAAFSVELTETSPIFARLDLTTLESDRQKLWGTDSGLSSNAYDTVFTGGYYERVRVVRTEVNGYGAVRDGATLQVITPNRVVLDKYMDTRVRTFLHEGDFLSDGELDIDWSYFAADNADLGTNIVGAAGITNVTYRIVLGNGTIDVNETNNVLAVNFKRAFDPDGMRVVPTIPADSQITTFNCPYPTFTWSMDGFNSYTAFRVMVWDESGNEVYDSGCRRAPVVHNKTYTWTCDAAAGDVFELTGNYTWKVAMYNAKFRDDDNEDDWSEEGYFSFDVDPNGLPRFAGYDALSACVKYAGPSDVLRYGKVRVQAYASPDCAGKPVSATYFDDRTTLTTFTDTTANVRLAGAPDNGYPYYVMAYVDMNGNKVRDSFESYGIGEVAKAGDVAGIWIEDTDTNQNWLPDALEYVGNDDKTWTEVRTANAGLMLKSEKVALSSSLVASLNQSVAALGGYLSGASLDSFQNTTFASLLFGSYSTGSTWESLVASIEKNVKAESGRVTVEGFVFDASDGKVYIDVDADVQYDTAGEMLRNLYNVNTPVTVTVWRKETLTSEWAKVYTGTITPNGTSERIVVDTKLGNVTTSGFYKVEVK